LCTSREIESINIDDVTVLGSSGTNVRKMSPEKRFKQPEDGE